MTSLRRTAFIAACMVLITGAIVSAQTSVSIGVHIGPPPPPQVVYVAPPPPPEPAYVWVPGYWYPVKHRYVWHEGYYTRPPYPGASWVSARYEREMYFAGYWSGPRGVIVHEHRWDNNQDRDSQGNGRGRGRGHNK